VILVQRLYVANCRAWFGRYCSLNCRLASFSLGEQSHAHRDQHRKRHSQGRFAEPLQPSFRLLRLLLAQTGSPQVNPDGENIGPRPDLARALPAID